MTTEDFITDLFCRVDDRMKNVPNPSQASLWPSELVTIGYFQSHLALAVVAFNLLIAWDGLPAQEDGFVPLSIAEFNLKPKTSTKGY